jgi:hypothetical protein
VISVSTIATLRIVGKLVARRSADNSVSLKVVDDDVVARAATVHIDADEVTELSTWLARTVVEHGDQLSVSPVDPDAAAEHLTNDRIGAALEIHYDDHGVCAGCDALIRDAGGHGHVPWPCGTARALGAAS